MSIQKTFLVSNDIQIKTLASSPFLNIVFFLFLLNIFKYYLIIYVIYYNVNPIVT